MFNIKMNQHFLIDSFESGMCFVGMLVFALYFVGVWSLIYFFQVASTDLTGFSPSGELHCSSASSICEVIVKT